MLRVTLINPPQVAKYPQPPIGLALIAAVLEQKGYRVTLLDANILGLKPKNLIPLVVEADVVGLTAITPTIGSVINIAHRLKQYKPSLTIILGGIHATLFPEETLAKAPAIDFIVKGEGEETIVEVLHALENGLPLDKIAGICYRSDGQIIDTASRSGSVNLDSLPFPAYHLLPWQKYQPAYPPHSTALPFTAVVTSRGCPYRCAYCYQDASGKTFQGQSPERVLAEITYLKERFGIKEFAFYDDIFTLDNERAHAIADALIKKELYLRWTCETRVDLVDKKLLQHIKQAGCYAIAYSIESASPKILNVLQKDTTVAQIEAAIRISREAGLQTIGNFMIGSPGESPQTIAKTIQLAKKLKLDFARFSLVIPFPGTELYRQYLKEGNVAVPWESFIYPTADNQLIPLFTSRQLSRNDLQDWLRRAYREFYLRPSYFWQRIKGISTTGELKANFKGFFVMLRNVISCRQRVTA